MLYRKRNYSFRVVVSIVILGSMFLLMIVINCDLPNILPTRLPIAENNQKPAKFFLSSH